MGLVVAMLSVTGVVIWWRKRRARAKAGAILTPGRYTGIERPQSYATSAHLRFPVRGQICEQANRPERRSDCDSLQAECVQLKLQSEVVISADDTG